MLRKGRLVDSTPSTTFSAPPRSRRSCLSVPGSSTKMLDKSRGLAADEVLFDLEDAVAPQAKADARANVVAALTHATSAAGGARGAVMLGDEMIDGASRKMALVIAAKGRAAGLSRTGSSGASA